MNRIPPPLPPPSAPATAIQEPARLIGTLAVLRAVGAVVAAAALVAGWIWAVSSDRTSLGAQVDRHEEALVDHEARLRAQESRQTEIATDVRWIRDHLQGREAR